MDVQYIEDGGKQTKKQTCTCIKAQKSHLHSDSVW